MKIDLKAILSLLFLIALVFFLLNYVFATDVTYIINSTDSGIWVNFTFNVPVNNSILYNKTIDYLYFPNITTNNSFGNCKFMWNNNGTYFDMLNTSAANHTWANASGYDFFDDNPGSWNNFTFFCHNSSTNTTFTNTSLYRYKVYSGTYQILPRSIVNNTIYRRMPAVINMSTNRSAKACFIVQNRSTVMEMINSTPQNITPGGTNLQWWTNATSPGEVNTGFNTDFYGFNSSHNITYYCEDAYGNKTWYNTTTGTAEVFYKLDSLDPVLTGTPTYVLYNNTTGGNKLEVTFNITDENPGVCFIRLMYEGAVSQTYNISGTVSYNNSIKENNCSINITPSEIVKDGYVVVTPTARDVVGNYANDSSRSFIFYRLKTGWNLVTGYENKTLETISGEFKNVTYVSAWDNLNKSFSTWTFGSNTNQNVSANFSSKFSTGAAYIYATEDIVTMRRHYAVSTAWQNVTTYANTSGERTSWNILGMTKDITNVNETIAVNSTCSNATLTILNESINLVANLTGADVSNPFIVSVQQVWNKTFTLTAANYSWNETSVWLIESGGIDPAVDYNVSYKYSTALTASNCANITWISWWDIQNGKFCSFYRNRLATGCSMTSAEMNLTRGDALWIATDYGINMTIERNKW